MNAEIITIGDEILIGQTIDTNSAWIGEQMSLIGLPVRRITTIQDVPDEIIRSINEAMQRSQVVLVTGGLGPTRDDRTKDSLLKLFGGSLREDTQVLKDIHEFLSSRSIPVNEMNRKQALVPTSCRVMRNHQGTAPGMWFDKEGKVVVSMPGVPFEMKDLMTREVLPELKKRFAEGVIIHKTLMTTGIPESVLTQTIQPWEDALPSHIRLAYLPSPGMVKLRLTGTGTDRARLSKEIEEIAERLKPYLPDGLYESEEIPLEKVIGKMLKEHHFSLAVAESCTGGFLAHLMTRYPGSSQFFKGGVVAYSNEIKEHLLHVDSKVLEVHGAVSEEVVRQMAESVRLQFHANWGIGISGIAGPDGGTTRKPVGTVWIAVSNDSETTARLFHFGTDRNRNILRAAMAAMNLLRLRLSD